MQQTCVYTEATDQINMCPLEHKLCESRDLCLSPPAHPGPSALGAPGPYWWNEGHAGFAPGTSWLNPNS